MDNFKITKSNRFNIFEAIENFLKKSRQEKLEVDISELSLIDASRTALLCSTRFFAKYPHKKIRWAVADEETRKIISNMKLINMELQIKQAHKSVKDTFGSKVYVLK